MNTTQLETFSYEQLKALQKLIDDKLVYEHTILSENIHLPPGYDVYKICGIYGDPNLNIHLPDKFTNNLVIEIDTDTTMVFLELYHCGNKIYNTEFYSPREVSVSKEYNRIYCYLR